MKIIFVTREGFDMPGGRIRCFDMAAALEKRGIASSVFSFPDHLGAKSGRAEGGMGLVAKCRYNLRAFFDFLFLRGRAVVVLQRVHYHVFGPYLAARLRRFPVILDMDDWEFRETELGRGLVSGSRAAALARFLARRARLCLAASAYLKDFLAAENPKTQLLPSGVNLSRLDPYRKPRALKSGPVVFGWLGTVFRPEDVEDLKMLLRVLRDVLRTHPDLRLDIAGDGLYLDEVREYASGLGFPRPGALRFLGWLKPGDVGAFIYEIDIGLNPVCRPSKFNLSKCPVSLLEFMACAKATVSSRVGEAARIVRSGTDGLLADNENMFAEHMRMLVNEPVFRTRLGESARDRAEKLYSVGPLADRLAGILADEGLCS